MTQTRTFEICCSLVSCAIDETFPAWSELHPVKLSQADESLADLLLYYYMGRF